MNYKMKISNDDFNLCVCGVRQTIEFFSFETIEIIVIATLYLVIFFVVLQVYCLLSVFSLICVCLCVISLFFFKFKKRKIHRNLFDETVNLHRNINRSVVLLLLFLSAAHPHQSPSFVLIRTDNNRNLSRKKTTEKETSVCTYVRIEYINKQTNEQIKRFKWNDKKTGQNLFRKITGICL